MKAPAKIVAVSRTEAIENIGNPFAFLHSNPTIGLVPSSMQGACQFEKAVIYQWRDMLRF